MNDYLKRIVTHKSGNNPTHDEWTYSNGFIVSNGSYDKSFAAFTGLATEAKRDFPHLTDKDITCFVVTKSSSYKGFPGVHFSLEPNTSRPDYSARDYLNFEYT